MVKVTIPVTRHLKCNDERNAKFVKRALTIITVTVGETVVFSEYNVTNYVSAYFSM
jgi:hypothetical protein